MISITMPVKNAAPYLRECLDSLLVQSETNWELWAVDDASTDQSAKILEEYAQKDNRIHWLKNEGEGIIPALQMAYSNSTGSYIHRMDADDVMPPNKLRALKALLGHYGLGHVSTGHVKYFAEGGVSDGYLQYQDWLNSLCDNGTHWAEIYKECVIASPCWMLHREDFEQCGGYQSDIYPEDYDLVFRFWEQGFKVVSSAEVLHLWRDHSGRTSRNHPHYQQNAFFDIKLHYFFKHTRDLNRPLVVWGAGTKGKIMARLLNERNEDYTWVSNNPNKHDKEIYNKTMKSYEEIVTKENPQVIVTVAQRHAKAEIITFLNGLELKEAQDYWFFR